MLSTLLYRQSLEYWQKATLDYNWYWIFAVFLGWTGIDMLYLRSPLMAVTKIILNILTLGYYWFYDAMEATFNQEQIKAIGPTLPFFGPVGLAGGMFRGTTVNSGTEAEQAKHYNFMLYGLVLFTLGIFGGDSFLTGYDMSGYVRILLLISIIGAPLALLWFGYNIYIYIFRQDQLFDGLYDYFGAPKPIGSALCPNILETTTAWVIDTASVILSYIPILNWFAPLLKDLANRLYKAYGIAVDTAEAAMAAKEYVIGAPQALATGQAGGSDSFSDTVGATIIAATVASVIVSALLLTFWRNYQNATATAAQTGTTKPTTKRDKRGGEKSDDPPQPGNVGETFSE